MSDDSPRRSPHNPFDLIELLRGVAAWWVVLFHCQPFALTFPALKPWYDSGHCGVAIFFVLSGYCICSSACRSEGLAHAALPFLRRRILRIYPAYWASIGVIVVSPFCWMFLQSLWTGHFSYHPRGWMKWTWAEWLSIGTLYEVFDWGDLIPTQMNRFANFNGVYWTLGIEVQFYAVTAFILWLRRPILATTLLIAIMSLTVATSPTVATSGLFLVYFPMFAIGSLPLRDRFRWRDAAWLAVLCLASSAQMSLTSGESLDWNHPLVAGATGAILMLVRHGGNAARVAEAVCQSRVGWIGQWWGFRSYSLYLIHAPVWVWIQSAFAGWIAPGWSRDAATLLGLCLAAWAFFQLFEAPFLPQKLRAANQRLAQ